MTSVGMLGENRMSEKLDTPNLLKDTFSEKWKEVFIFNAVDDTEISYEDFFNAILNCRETLEGVGVKKGEVICLLTPNSFEMVTLYFAALTMQLTVVPIDIKKGEVEIKEILSQTNYDFAICDDPNLGFIRDTIELGKFKDTLYKKRTSDVDELTVFEDIDYDQIFLITFTSGSSGIPKGVMHSFNNLIASAVAFKNRFNFGGENIFYHNLPMAYMAGILNLIILPFVSGSKIVISEPFNISNVLRFWDFPIKYSVNTFWFIPTIISLLLKLDRSVTGVEYTDKSNIIGCVGTAPLHNKLKKSFEERYGIHLYESYGLSETLFVTTNSNGKDKSDSVGEVLNDVELSFSQDSEILISVPWMFLGYSNIESESYFENGEFRSGDLGVIDENGFLTITGRKKDLIIRGGVNISPKKIEDFVRGFDIFEEHVILGIEDSILGEKTVCFLVRKKGSSRLFDKKKLNNEIISKLGGYYCIDEFVEVKDIPKNLNGKTDKIQIKEMYNCKIQR